MFPNDFFAVDEDFFFRFLPPLFDFAALDRRTRSRLWAIFINFDRLQRSPEDEIDLRYLADESGSRMESLLISEPEDAVLRATEVLKYCGCDGLEEDTQLFDSLLGMMTSVFSMSFEFARNPLKRFEFASINV